MISSAPKHTVHTLLFDCRSQEALPGWYTPNPQSSNDLTIRFVHQNICGILDFFSTCFNRNSLDGSGLSVVTSVHFGHFHANAFWNGFGLVFGDGDGQIFRSMASADDFIAHEFMHGVTQYTCNLEYEGQAGALNESFSDVFGCLFRQWQVKAKAQETDWMFGADLMGPTAISNGWYCLRSLRDPAAAYSLSKQPKHFSDYINGGGPHDNSGIPNHAFYLLANELGGFSWERAGLIWYKTIKSLSDPATDLATFANLTYRTASDLFPSDVTVKFAVRSAWQSVGVAI